MVIVVVVVVPVVVEVSFGWIAKVKLALSETPRTGPRVYDSNSQDQSPKWKAEHNVTFYTKI